MSLNNNVGANVMAASGAPNLNTGDGAAYVYMYMGPAYGWQPHTQFHGPPGQGWRFGTSVVVGNSSCVVGAPYANSNKGAVLVYGVTDFGNLTARSMTWTHVATQAESDAGATCGTSIAGVLKSQTYCYV